MEGPDGPPWVAEVNFPCHFVDETPLHDLPDVAATAGVRGGAGRAAVCTVADHIVHFLAAKADMR